ncbi:acyl carrier protein [Pseudomonas sp. ABY48]|uniref:acyl carrier protein n=1 Tax=Pseudomonas sp. ABY48 TaxID=3402865 RepID=UPI003B434F37
MPLAMEEKLFTLLSDYAKVPREKISVHSRMQDFAEDSLAITELSFKLRKAFEVPIADEDLDPLETVGELIELVDTRLAS